MAMAVLPRCSCLTTYNSYCSLGPCADAVHGAAGHNRWGVAETPLPVKTQGRNLDGSLTFNVYAVCRVAWAPSPEPDCQDGRRSSAQVLSERAAGGEGGDLSTVSGPRGSGARWLTEHAAHPGAATREPTRSPRGRQCEYPSQGDHPQNWRATSQGPASGRYIFNTVGVLALLWSLAFVYLFGELLVCVFIAFFPYSLVWRSSLLFFVLPGSCLRASACLAITTISSILRHPSSWAKELRSGDRMRRGKLRFRLVPLTGENTHGD